MLEQAVIHPLALPQAEEDEALFPYRGDALLLSSVAQHETARQLASLSQIFGILLVKLPELLPAVDAFEGAALFQTHGEAALRPFEMGKQIRLKGFPAIVETADQIGEFGEEETEEIAHIVLVPIPLPPCKVEDEEGTLVEKYLPSIPRLPVAEQ
jgi:hypothetical protein